MYEELTKYIPLLKDDYYGKWYQEKSRKQTYMPYVVYSKIVHDLRDVMADFLENHEEYQKIKYYDVIEKQNIESRRLEDVDVSVCDAESIIALIDGAYQLERFCDGYVLDMFKNGIIQKWLERLKQIDDETIV